MLTRWIASRIRTLALPVVVALGLTVGPAGALTLTSNLAEAPVGNFLGVNQNSWLATSFTTDANAYTLDSVGIDIKYNPSSNNPTFALAVHSDSSGSPGGSVATLSGSSDPSSGVHTYSTTGTVNLAASTTYWVVASNSAADIVYLDFTSSDNQTGPGSIGDIIRRSSDGSDWSGAPDQYALLLSAEVTVVPEPGTLLLLGFGLAGLAAAGRRRKERG